MWENNICPPSTEDEVVYEYNHTPIEPPTFYCDPLNVYDIHGKLIGYNWNYGDSIQLDIDLNNTVLHSDDEHLELYEMYLSDKQVEINFIDTRGNVVYTFNIPAALKTKLKLNYSEETMIKRNQYTCTLVLINPYDSSRINLLHKPYIIYVK